VEQLRRDGLAVGRRRIAETMARAGVQGISGRERSTTTTRRDRLEAPFPDLVGRRFQPAAPDALCYGDVTYLWAEDRFWYLAQMLMVLKASTAWLRHQVRCGGHRDARDRAVGLGASDERIECATIVGFRNPGRSTEEPVTHGRPDNVTKLLDRA
jgi:transposase InsO family protein